MVYIVVPYADVPYVVLYAHVVYVVVPYADVPYVVLYAHVL